MYLFRHKYIYNINYAILCLVINVINWIFPQQTSSKNVFMTICKTYYNLDQSGIYNSISFFNWFGKRIHKKNIYFFFCEKILNFLKRNLCAVSRSSDHWNNVLATYIYFNTFLILCLLMSHQLTVGRIWPRRTALDTEIKKTRK